MATAVCEPAGDGVTRCDATASHGSSADAAPTRVLVREQLVEQKWQALIEADAAAAETSDAAARRRVTECGLDFVLQYVEYLRARYGSTRRGLSMAGARSFMGAAIVHLAHRLRDAKATVRCVAQRTGESQRSIDERKRDTRYHLWLRRIDASEEQGGDGGDDDDEADEADGNDVGDSGDEAQSDALLEQCGLLVGTGSEATTATSNDETMVVEAPSESAGENDDATRRGREAARREASRFPSDLRAALAANAATQVVIGTDEHRATWHDAALMCPPDRFDEARAQASVDGGAALIASEARSVRDAIREHADAQRAQNECESLRGTGVQCMRMAVQEAHVDALIAAVRRAQPFAEKCILGATHEQLIPIALQYFGTSARDLGGKMPADGARRAWLDVYTVQLRRYVVEPPSDGQMPDGSDAEEESWFRNLAHVAASTDDQAHPAMAVDGARNARLRAWLSNETHVPDDELSDVDTHTFVRYVHVKRR